MDDPIVEEVRRIREEHAKKFDYNLDVIFADLKAREARSENVFVSFPAKRIETIVKKPITDSKSVT